MTIRVRERKRLAFYAMIKERNLTPVQVSELLHVSLDTVRSWLKPETSKSSYPVPDWAPELLAFKVPIKPGPKEVDLAYQRKVRATKRTAAR